MNYQTQPRASVFSANFQAALSYMNRTQCGFVTALRKEDLQGAEETAHETVRRNKQLEAAVRASGLSYIRATGDVPEHPGKADKTTISESVFCIINNRFAPADFVKLMVYWCNQFDLDDIFVTAPMPERSPSDGRPAVTTKPIDVVGTYYDTYGSPVTAFHHATLEDAEVYFSNICGTDFFPLAAEYHKTEGHPIYSPQGRSLAIEDFQDLYPELG